MRLLLSVLLVLLYLTGVMAQSVPAACGNVPVDVTFKPSNCLASGGASTLETARFRGVGIVNLFVMGPSGRVGSRDRGMRVDGDGVLRLRIDTTDFFGSQMPAGAYSVIIKDMTGRIAPIIAPFTVAGNVAPVVPTARVVTTPTPLTTTATATRTSVPGGTPTATARGTPNRMATATLSSVNAAILCRQTPNPDQAFNLPVVISDIDEEEESVTLENVTDETVNLEGWTMCSLTGDQVHSEIAGVIDPFANFDFYSNGDDEIWDDVAQDDGALYDPAGNLISYFKDQD